MERKYEDDLICEMILCIAMEIAAFFLKLFKI
jgi:hypothetical protein